MERYYRSSGAIPKDGQLFKFAGDDYTVVNAYVMDNGNCRVRIEDEDGNRCWVQMEKPIGENWKRSA